MIVPAHKSHHSCYNDSGTNSSLAHPIILGLQPTKFVGDGETPTHKWFRSYVQRLGGAHNHRAWAHTRHRQGQSGSGSTTSLWTEIFRVIRSRLKTTGELNGAANDGKPGKYLPVQTQSRGRWLVVVKLGPATCYDPPVWTGPQTAKSRRNPHWTSSHLSTKG